MDQLVKVQPTTNTISQEAANGAVLKESWQSVPWFSAGIHPPSEEGKEEFQCKSPLLNIFSIFHENVFGHTTAYRIKSFSNFVPNKSCLQACCCRFGVSSFCAVYESMYCNHHTSLANNFSKPVWLSWKNIPTWLDGIVTWCFSSISKDKK